MDDRKIQNAFNGIFVILETQQKAIEWMVRDLGDKVQRALPDVRKARELIDRVIEVGKAHDAAEVKS